MAKKKELERLLADLKRRGREISEIVDALGSLLSGEEPAGEQVGS